jgi:hypothetical protein
VRVGVGSSGTARRLIAPEILVEMEPDAVIGGSLG